MLPGSRLDAVVRQGRRVDPQDGAHVWQRYVRSDPVTDANPDTQLLHALSNERVDLGLAGLHPPTGKLPLAGEVIGVAALLGEKTPGSNDGRPHHDLT